MRVRRPPESAEVSVGKGKEVLWVTTFGGESGKAPLINRTEEKESRGEYML
jgi:hypothetical protein